MAEFNNIDNIFKKSAGSFSAQAPDSAWGKLSSSIIRKRMIRRVYRVYIPVASILISSLIIYLFNINPSIGAFEYATLKNSSIIDSSQKSANLNDNSDIGGLEGSGLKANFAENQSENNEDSKEIETQISKNKSTNPLETTKQTLEIPAKPQELYIVKTAEIEGDIENQLTEKISLKFFAAKMPEIIYNADPQISREYNKKYLKTYNDGVFKYLSFNIFYGPDISFRDLRGKNPEPVYTAYTDNEKPNYGLSGGVFLNYNFMPNFELSIGAIVSKIGFLGDFKMPPTKQSYLKLSRFGYTSGGYYEVDEIVQVLSANSIESVDQIRYYQKIRTTYSVFSTPIRLNYFKNIKKLKFNLFAGFSPTIVYSNSVELGDYNNWEAIGHIEETADYLFGASFGFGVDYKLSPNFKVGIEPELTYYFNSISTNEAFNSRPFIFRFAPGVTYSF